MRCPGLNRAQRAATVYVASMQELNDHLTVIMNALDATLTLLPKDHPADRLLVEAFRASKLAASRVAMVLQLARREGAVASAVSADTLIEAEYEP